MQETIQEPKQYWYFLFEGKLVAEKEFSSFYSSVLLPVLPKQNPETVLKSALAEYHATLIKVEDYFEFIAEDYNKNDRDNDVWFDWCDEVRRTKQAKFTPWQRFNAD